MKKKIIIFLIVTIPLILFFNYSYPENIRELQTISLFDSDNQLIYSQTANHENTYVSYEEIPEKIINIFVAIEDKRFFSHHGFDLLRIFKSIIVNFSGKSQGASTITQQLARMLFLNNEKTYSRKFKELIIAIRLEQVYSKEEILECYLNNLYFGHNIYGIKDASDFFFKKELNNLTTPEIAILVSIIKGPTIYSPINNITNCITRQKLILEQINYNGMSNYLIVGKMNDKYPSSVRFYKDIVISLVKETSVNVYTNYDSKLNNLLSNYDVAICAIKPDSGDVLAITSGKYHDSSYNKAYLSKRQIGSTIKPLLYYQALNCGLSPLSEFTSEKTTFTINGIEYSPTNYKDQYPETSISMCYALATSDNIYAMKTHLYIGMDKLSNMLNKFNIKNEKTPSLALGTVEATLLELTSIYNTFASLGVYHKPSYIQKVEHNGKIIYQNQTKPTRILNEKQTFIINQMMTYTFNRNINSSIKVTGNSISYLLTKKFAGKSGSTDYDSYMLGFNKSLTLGVLDCTLDNNTTINDNGTVKRIWASIAENYATNDWYEDIVTPVYTNPSPLNDYKCNVYLNDYLPIYQK